MPAILTHSRGTTAMTRLPISVVLAVLCISAAPALADEPKPTLKQQTSKGYIESDEVFTRSKHNRQITLVAQQAIRRGDYDRAIKLLTRALEINDDDMDSHRLLAEALQDKLEGQDERDPYVYEKCLKEWLIVYRGEVGEEKGLTFHGMGFMTDRFADDDRGIIAKKQLIKLTGHAPKMWETDNKYITRMMRKDSSNVSGKVVHDNEKKLDFQVVPKVGKQKAAADNASQQ